MENADAALGFIEIADVIAYALRARVPKLLFGCAAHPERVKTCGAPLFSLQPCALPNQGEAMGVMLASILFADLY